MQIAPTHLEDRSSGQLTDKISSVSHVTEYKSSALIQAIFSAHGLAGRSVSTCIKEELKFSSSRSGYLN